MVCADTNSFNLRVYVFSHYSYTNKHKKMKKGEKYQTTNQQPILVEDNFKYSILNYLIARTQLFVCLKV